MSYPTQSLAKVLDDIDRSMIAVKAIAERANERSIAGPVGSTEIFDMMITLRNQRGIIASLSLAPGLADYAQSQKGNDQLDVASEFVSVLAALDTVVSWIEDSFPKHDGFLLAQTLGQNGPVDRMFSTADLATYRTQLAALIATID